MSVLEQLEDQITALTRRCAARERELLDTRQALEKVRWKLDDARFTRRDALTECAFWKSAAERALRMWDTAQNTVDDLNVLVQSIALQADNFADMFDTLRAPKNARLLRSMLEAYVQRAAELAGDVDAPTEQ